MPINFSFLDFIQAQMPNYYDELKIEPFIQVGKSGIKIKKKNRGKFTEYCGGTVTSACIARGKNSSDPAVRKRATFAANARKWKHKEGGYLQKGGYFTEYTPFESESQPKAEEQINITYSPDEDVAVKPNWDNESTQNSEEQPIQKGYNFTYGTEQTTQQSQKSNNWDAIYDYLSVNANPKSIKRCAEYVRKALEAGGFNTTGHPASAYMYKQFAPSIGFREVGRGVGNQLPQGYTPGNKLTMVVYDRTPEHPHGHVAIYNPKTKKWTSDFEQNNMNVWSDIQGNYSMFEYA